MNDDVRINPLTGKPISAADILDDPEFKAFAARVTGELVPKLTNSGFTMALVPGADIDVKFAVELGVSIMLSKPILIVVPSNMPIPPKLRLVADEVVRAPADFNMKDPAFQKRLLAAVERMKKKAAA